MKKIKLTTKKELNIFMNPTRQQLLYQLAITKTPMTPKMLADKLCISASSVQYHIKKLISLNLIELDHTEVINGITASFYKPTQVTVQIGLDQADALAPQRKVLLQNSIAQVYEGFNQQIKKVARVYGNSNAEHLQKWGDILTGIVHLSEEESNKLLGLIYTFLEQHAKPTADSNPWSYAIIAYNAAEIDND